ncbi:MAG: TetR family transcriptional regulator [SAR324 cluster bacterium]|nr:TetR family transcriptional regulator [SAR324 cluster bacterium]
MTRKEKLIQATKEHLIEIGEANFSLRAIATRAGVNHGLVQYYFGGLEGMVTAAIENFAMGAFKGLREKLKDSQNKEDAFLIIAEDFIGNENFSKLFLAIAQLGERMPGVRAFHQKMVLSRRAELKKILGFEEELDILLLQTVIFGGVMMGNIDPTFNQTLLMKHFISKLNILPSNLKTPNAQNTTNPLATQET